MAKDLNTILRIDSSARKTGSATRALADRVIDRLSEVSAVQIITRDVADGLPFVDEAWVGANFTPEEDRTDGQRDALALSDSLVAEIEAADTLLLGLPIYNFGVPATLKAWVDMVARARKTFRYGPDGPVGLMSGKRAIIVLASGGTAVDSDVDFATPYLRHALGFIGIHDVTVIAADAMSKDTDAKTARIDAAIKTLT